MVISAEQRSQFTAHHRQWWRLQMSEKFSSGTKNSKQTNKIDVILKMQFIRPIQKIFFQSAEDKIYVVTRKHMHISITENNKWTQEEKICA